ncbi:uncharacterized protein IWZ02DRAFT_438168 [Phyllosticta citriasiana]|uniref:uncharacterized protein n=1 Tax=Phyllosticta citriasiana TaxID=595635 RepID=UPI0030FDA1A0
MLTRMWAASMSAALRSAVISARAACCCCCCWCAWAWKAPRAFVVVVGCWSSRWKAPSLAAMLALAGRVVGAAMA